MKIRSPFRKSSRHASGGKAQGLVEFALVLPILLMLILGIIEFGRLMFTYAAVVTAAREGARFGASTGSGGTARYLDCPGIRDAAQNLTSFVGVTDGDIEVDFDRGPGTSLKFDNTCPTTTDQIEGGVDRVIVRVTANWSPIAYFFTIGPIPITNESARTVIKDIDLDQLLNTHTATSTWAVPPMSTNTSTPGPSETPTETATPGPSPTDGPSPTSTATATATATATSTSTATPTPTLGAACASIDSFNPDDGDKRLDVSVTNGSGIQLVLTDLTIIFQDTSNKNGSLKEIKMKSGGNENQIYDTEGGSPRVVDSNDWKGGTTSDRTFSNGQNKTLQFLFDKGAESTGYSLTLVFDNGCSVSGGDLVIDTATPTATASATPTATTTPTASNTPLPTDTPTPSPVPTDTPTQAPGGCQYANGGVDWPTRKNAEWTINNQTSTSNEITKITVSWPYHGSRPRKLNYVRLDGNDIFSGEQIDQTEAVLCESGCENQTANWTSRSVNGNATAVIRFNWSRNNLDGDYNAEMEFDNGACTVSVTFQK